MSGGAVVKAAGGVEGITRSARNSVKEDRGHAPPAPARGLALTARGPQAPLFLEKAAASRDTNSAAGWPIHCTRDRHRTAQTPHFKAAREAASERRVEPGPALDGRA